MQHTQTFESGPQASHTQSARDVLAHDTLAERSEQHPDRQAAQHAEQYTDQQKADAQVDAHTVRAREAERAALRADIEAFLNSGGKVTTVAANLRTDGPRKPQNNYGKGSL